jgi:polyisoprenyl-phosphate glycosyltransferase
MSAKPALITAFEAADPQLDWRNDERVSERALVSVIIPVFNEAARIEANLAVISDVLAAGGTRYELLVVDDGSSDDTWAKLLVVSAIRPELRAVRLSRNFGKEAALCAGLDLAQGDACIVMDSDLQHPPALIPEMLRMWRDEGYPIVEAVKRSRGTEGIVNRWGARLFYGTMQKVAGMDLHHTSDFKLLDARIVAAWKLLKERQTFFRGMTAWLGFPRGKVYFEVPERAGSGSRWTKTGLVKLAVTAVTSFSSLPMQVVTTLGLLFLAAAVPLGIQTLYNKLTGVAVSGFTTVIILLLIVGSVLMISLGIIGTYIARIFDEVKQRPRYIAAEVVKLSSTGAGKRTH